MPPRYGFFPIVAFLCGCSVLVLYTYKRYFTEKLTFRCCRRWIALFSTLFHFSGKAFCNGVARITRSWGAKSHKRQYDLYLTQRLPNSIWKGWKKWPKKYCTQRTFSLPKCFWGHNKSICTMKIFTWLHLKKIVQHWNQAQYTWE